MPFGIVSDPNENHHFIYKQEDKESCGLACASMVIHRVKGRIVFETMLAEVSQHHKRGYNPKDGMYLDGVQNLLQIYGVQTKYKNDLSWNIIDYYSMKNRIIIAALEWKITTDTVNPHHFVVIDGINSFGSANILDPQKNVGLKLQYLQSSRFPFYHSVGKFTGHYLVAARYD